jgi:hypothetical protein
MIERARGKHGCFIHTDRQGDNGHWRPVRCSYHHVPMGPPTTESPTGVRGTTCGECGATVERVAEGRFYREVWTNH